MREAEGPAARNCETPKKLKVLKKELKSDRGGRPQSCEKSNSKVGFSLVSSFLRYFVSTCFATLVSTSTVTFQLLCRYFEVVAVSGSVGPLASHRPNTISENHDLSTELSEFFAPR